MTNASKAFKSCMRTPLTANGMNISRNPRFAPFLIRPAPPLIGTRTVSHYMTTGNPSLSTHLPDGTIPRTIFQANLPRLRAVSDVLGVINGTSCVLLDL